jgi:hypothetical protein
MTTPCPPLPDQATESPVARLRRLLAGMPGPVADAPGGTLPAVLAMLEWALSGPATSLETRCRRCLRFYRGRSCVGAVR